MNIKLEAVLKRNQEIESEAKAINFCFGRDAYNSELRELTLEHTVKRLSPREGDLLLLLIQHQNMLLSRSIALETLWEENDYFNGRSMDVHISKSRKYLALDPNLFITIIPRSAYIFNVQS